MVLKRALDEKGIIKKLVSAPSKEVSIEAFFEWRSNEEKKGESLVEEAFCFIAEKYDAFILSNPVNPPSYAHFIRSDVESKNFNIRERTLRNGIANGFLEPSPSFNLKQLHFNIGESLFYAVIREGRECLVEKISETDVPTFVSSYENNLYIVSDIDLISIYLKKAPEEKLFDTQYGELTATELLIIKDLNHYFHELIFKKKESSKPIFKLVSHGPANHFSNSKASHIHYPLKIYTPEKSIEYLNQSNPLFPEFLSFHQKMESLSYFSTLNPKWVF